MLTVTVMAAFLFMFETALPKSKSIPQFRSLLLNTSAPLQQSEGSSPNQSYALVILSYWRSLFLAIINKELLLYLQTNQSFSQMVWMLPVMEFLWSLLRLLICRIYYRRSNRFLLSMIPCQYRKSQAKALVLFAFFYIFFNFFLYKVYTVDKYFLLHSFHFLLN